MVAERKTTSSDGNKMCHTEDIERFSLVGVPRLMQTFETQECGIDCKEKRAEISALQDT